MFEHYIYMGGAGGGDLPRVTICKKGEFLKYMVHTRFTFVKKGNNENAETLIINGAQRWYRTTDTRIFSPLLYQLS